MPDAAERAEPTRATPNGSQSATMLAAEGVIEEVFLTPRVLDQGAFTEYARSLEDLIRRAGEQSKTLDTARSGVREITEKTGKAGRELGARLDLANNLLRAIDERAKQAEQKLIAAEQHLADVGQLDERVDARVEDAVAGIIEKIEAAGDAQLARCEKIEQRLHAAERAARTTAANAAATIVQLEERVQAIQARAEAIAEQSDLARQSLEVRSRELLDEIDSRAEALSSRFEGAEELAAQMRVLVKEGEDGATLAARIEQAAGRAERIAAQLDDLTATADTARNMLDDSVKTAGERVGTLEERAETVAPMNDAYEDIASSVPLLTETIRSASDQISELVKIQSSLRTQIGESAQLAADARDRLKDRTKDLETLLADATSRLESRAEGASERLTELIVRAERAATAMERAPQASPKPAPQARPTPPASGQGAPTRPNTPRPQRPANPLDSVDLSGSGNVIPVWRPRDPKGGNDPSEGTDRPTRRPPPGA
ncbi:MAG: hypothetical protein RIB60_02550 [Phycisphaerales bacterium]